MIASSGRSPNHAIITGIRISDAQWATALFNSRREDPGQSSPQRHRNNMKKSQRVFADFQNADRLGRIRLNTAGAKEDLARSNINLIDGMLLELYDDEIVALGVARHDENEGWVAEVDWNAIG